MKRISRLKITLSVAVLYLLTQLPRALPDLPVNTHWIVLAGVILSGYIEWHRSKPVLRLQDRRKVLFDQACKRAMRRLREHDPDARLNIMEIDGFLPLKQFRFFRIIYDLHVGKDDPDRGMRMKVWQGVAGQAAESGEFCYGDITDKEKGPRFGLNADQMKKTEDVRLVLSMPIRKAKQGGKDEPELSGKVIGVVNIDSKKEDAAEYYRTHMVNDQPLQERQEEALREISEYCSFIMS